LLRNGLPSLIDHRKKVFFSVGLTFLAVLISALVFWPKPKIEDVARSTAYKSFRGDSSLVISLTPDSDLAETDITKENWKKFLEIELIPRLRTLKISKEKLIMPANSGLVGTFYFVASRSSMNRDVGVGVESTGDGVVVPISVWIGMFASVVSITDLNIPDSEFPKHTKDMQKAAIDILQKYGIKKVRMGSHVRDLAVGM